MGWAQKSHKTVILLNAPILHIEQKHLSSQSSYKLQASIVCSTATLGSNFGFKHSQNLKINLKLLSKPSYRVPLYKHCLMATSSTSQHSWATQSLTHPYQTLITASNQPCLKRIIWQKCSQKTITDHYIKQASSSTLFFPVMTTSSAPYLRPVLRC